MLFGTVEGVDVVAQAAHGAEALAVLRAEEVDVVLADAKMPVMDGIELVRRCAREHPDLPVLVLTTFDEPDVVRGAVAAGAAGFLLKDTSIEALAEAVRAVAAGGLVIDPRVARLALAPSRDKRDEGDGPPSAPSNPPLPSQTPPPSSRIAPCEWHESSVPVISDTNAIRQSRMNR